MDFLFVLILGAISGKLASQAIKRTNSQSLIMDIVLGILGAILGAVLMTWFSQPGSKNFNFYSNLASISVAIFLVLLSRVVEMPVESPLSDKKDNA